MIFFIFSDKAYVTFSIDLPLAGTIMQKRTALRIFYPMKLMYLDCIHSIKDNRYNMSIIRTKPNRSEKREV